MKVKSHSGAKKRVIITATGKKMMRKGCKNHLLTKKSKRQKEAFKYGMPVSETNMDKLDRLLPNS